MVEKGMLKRQQIGPEDITGGNPKMILTVIWAIVRFAESTPKQATSQTLRPKKVESIDHSIVKKPLENLSGSLPIIESEPWLKIPPPKRESLEITLKKSSSSVSSSMTDTDNHPSSVRKKKETSSF